VSGASLSRHIVPTLRRFRHVDATKLMGFARGSTSPRLAERATGTPATCYFSQSLQADLACPVLLVKIIRFSSDPNHFTYYCCLVPHEGRLAIVTDAGRDAVDAGGATDESTACGRRSRVVLTPRRWRQACGEDAAGDGGKKARSPGRARYKPLKPLRAGMPGDPGVPVVATLVCHHPLHTRLRVQRAPGIPHALFGARNS
jgi:hypothetical protein